MLPPRIINELLREGAVLLPRYFSEADVQRFDPAATDVVRQSERVMRFAGLLSAARIYFKQAQVSIEFVEVTSPAQFHQDSRGRFGISFLAPISGPPATFYYSNVQQSYPDQMDNSKSFTYGPGDLVVLRQEFAVQHSAKERREYSQVYHTGIAAGERLLLACDIIPPSPHEIRLPLNHKVE